MWKSAKDERGSVESALVLIPLLILFLIAIQISYAAHARNVERVAVQDGASKRAISGTFNDSDQFIHIESSGDGQNLDLLVASNSVGLQDLLPGFLGGVSSERRVEISGFAVVENLR